MSSSPYAIDSNTTSTAAKRLSGTDLYNMSGASLQSPYANANYGMPPNGNNTAQAYSSYDSNDTAQDLNIEDAKMFVNWLAESVTRVGQLSSQIEVPQYAKELLLVLIDALGVSYIEVALDYAIERVQADKASDQTAEYFDRTVRLTNDILQLISNAANKHLMVLAADSSTIRKDMSQILMDYVAKIEDRVRVLESSSAQAPTTKKRWEKITRW